MPDPNLKAIPCKIFKASFSGERYFEFPLAEKVYESLAPRYHMWNSAKKHLDEFEPADYEPIDGFVDALIVGREANNKVVVFLPNSENVVIEESRLVERPLEAEHVSA